MLQPVFFFVFNYGKRISSYTMFQIRLLLAIVLVQLVFGYESVYDIIERRNQRRRIGTRNRYPEHGLFAEDPYPAFDGKPRSSFGYVRPIGYEHFGGGYFGNGYDNIGNGNIPRRDRFYYLSRESYHPKYQRHFRERFDAGREHPNFYNSYYYLTPRQDFKDDYSKLNSGVLKTDSFVLSKEGNNHRQGMETFGDKQSAVVNDSNKKESYGEKSFVDRNGENKSSLRSNRFIKKGHITKGFSNHHHKDETGNSTTFYDEFLDHGGQSDFKDVADGFGTKTTLDHVSNGENVKFFRENEAEAGNYGSGSVKGDEKSEKDVVLRENSFGKDENFHFEGGNVPRRRNFVHGREDFDLPYYTDY